MYNFVLVTELLVGKGRLARHSRTRFLSRTVIALRDRKILPHGTTTATLGGFTIRDGRGNGGIGQLLTPLAGSSGMRVTSLTKRVGLRARC